jgi:hypothetical protein
LPFPGLNKVITVGINLEFPSSLMSLNLREVSVGSYRQEQTEC